MISAAAEPAPKPLEGLRVLVLRPDGQAEELAGRLTAEAAVPVVVPAVEIVLPEDSSRLDAALERLNDFDWVVLTSVNGADVFIERLNATGRQSALRRTRIAAIGPATRARLKAGGLIVNWIPGSYTTRALAEELPFPSGESPATSAGKRPTVCLFRADIASTDLEKALTTRGFKVERVNVYGTRPVNPEQIRQTLTSGSVDAVALTSASIADSFAAAASGVLPGGLQIFSIGPATSEACRAHGLRVDAEAHEHSAPGIVEAMKRHRARA